VARLFFALWPPAPVRAALAELQAQVLAPRTRAIPSANLHATLVFLGEIDAARRADLDRAARSISAPAFELRIERAGWWRRTGIVWAAPRQVPAPLLGLHAELSARLVAAGFPLEARTYLPHVTLARRARRRPREHAMTPVVWPVSAWHLMESIQENGGSRYEPLACWDLVPSASA
jgi:2'-5' RNA ligase